MLSCVLSFASLYSSTCLFQNLSCLVQIVDGSEGHLCHLHQQTNQRINHFQTWMTYDLLRIYSVSISIPLAWYANLADAQNVTQCWLVLFALFHSHVGAMTPISPNRRVGARSASLRTLITLSKSGIHKFQRPSSPEGTGRNSLVPGIGFHMAPPPVPAKARGRFSVLSFLQQTSGLRRSHPRPSFRRCHEISMEQPRNWGPFGVRAASAPRSRCYPNYPRANVH